MAMPTGVLDTYRGRAEGSTVRWPTPGALAKHVDHRTRQTRPLDLIDQVAVDILDGKIRKQQIYAPPQIGKSERVSHWMPLWWLTREPSLRIAIVSAEQELAVRWGRQIKRDVEDNPDLGLRLRSGSKAAGRWETAQGGGLYCVGIGGTLTGRPVDLLIIDDPIKDRAQADSKAYRERLWDWYEHVAKVRAQRIVLMNTRWHQDDLSGRLTEREPGEWTILSVPAICEAPDDPLGREIGDEIESANPKLHTPGWFTQMQATTSAYVWAALYQQRPSPAAGGTFKRDWWREYDTPLWTVADNGTRTVPGAGNVITSWDMTFKDSKASDFVVGQVWLRRGADAYLLDQVRRRMGFTETLAAVKQLHARWPQASTKLIEDKANGSAVIDSLRKTVPGIVPVTPHESKEARASAVTPFIEAGNVHLPSPRLAPWVGEFVEETASFPNGTHDDQVDALSQALHRLYLTGSTTSFLHQLAPPCPVCGVPVPSSEPDCPTCRTHGPMSELERLTIP